MRLGPSLLGRSLLGRSLLGPLRRSPAAFWTAAGALALLTGLVVARLVGAAQAEADRYGSPRSVAVAVRLVPAGEVVSAGDVEVRRVPAAFVPRGALPSPPVGRTVVVPLFPGEPVLRAKLAPEGLGGVAALLPRGTRAVAVPTGGASAPVRRGDVVDVLATFDPATSSTPGSGGGPGQEPTFPVATGARVVDVGPETATVAVSPEQARRVAFAAAHGVVTMALTGGPSA